MDRYIVGKGEDIWLADNYAKVMKTITTQDLQKLLNNQSDRIDELQNQLKSQPKEIIDKIENYCDIKHFYPEFVEKDYQEFVVSYTSLIEFLDTILKEYQKQTEKNNG